MRPRSVTCVHKPWHLEWNTPGSPGREAGIFSGLLSKHIRYQVFTFFVRSRIRDQIASRVEDRKKPNGPNWISSNRLTKKRIPHTWCQRTMNYYLGWLMWCNVCISYEPSYKSNFAVEIFRMLFQTNRVSLVQTLYQHKSALPYMGCCTLSSCSSTKGTKDAGTHNPTDQGIDNKKNVRSPWWLEVAPKMKSGRPTNILLQLLLLVAVSTNTGLRDSSYNKIQLLRATV